MAALPPLCPPTALLTSAAQGETFWGLSPHWEALSEHLALFKKKNKKFFSLKKILRVCRGQS